MGSRLAPLQLLTQAQAQGTASAALHL